MRAALASMPSDIKEENRKAVLQAFHGNDALTAAEIAEKTGISRQTVKKSIEYFLENGQLYSRGKGSSSQMGGKRPELFCLNDEVRLMCILVHHHEVILNLTDLHYNCLAHWTSGMVSIDSLDELFALISTGVDALVPGAARKRVQGVCFAVPLGRDAQEHLTVATPFPRWPRSDYGRSIKDPLLELFPNVCNLNILSDGRAAAGALLQRDYARYAGGDLATFYCSTGVGGALFHNGQITKNDKQVVGALGHIIVDPSDQEPCGCGSHGCLERMVSRQRMRQRLAARPGEYASSVLADTPVEQVTFAQLFAGSEQGDELCRSESRYYAEMFSVAMRSLILTVGPEHVVFQGDFGLADSVFRQELLNRMFAFKYLDVGYNIEVVYDKNDLTDEETFGATFFLVQDYLENPEKYVATQK